MKKMQAEMQIADAPSAIDAAQMEHRLHELSQPVTAVSVALCVAAASDSATERIEVLQAAQRECDRIIVQIRQMREMLQSAEGSATQMGARSAAVCCISAGQPAQGGRAW